MWLDLQKLTMSAQVTLSYVFANIFSLECSIYPFLIAVEEQTKNYAVVMKILFWWYKQLSNYDRAKMEENSKFLHSDGCFCWSGHICAKILNIQICGEILVSANQLSLKYWSKCFRKWRELKCSMIKDMNKASDKRNVVYARTLHITNNLP